VRIADDAINIVIPAGKRMFDTFMAFCGFWIIMSNISNYTAQEKPEAHHYSFCISQV